MMYVMCDMLSMASRTCSNFKWRCREGHLDILKELDLLGEAHANDGHHGQAAVGELCVEFFSAQGGVLDGGAEAKVSQAEAALAIVAWLGGLLVHHELQEAGEG